jgi:hypothetical protein
MEEGDESFSISAGRAMPTEKMGVEVSLDLSSAFEVNLFFF